MTGILVGVLLLSIGAFISSVIVSQKPEPFTGIERIQVPNGTNGICAVDKDGLLVHVKIAIYDSEGHFVAQAEPPHPYECAMIPGMKAGDYWVRLFKK